jgi:hypothetical protein
VLWDPRVQLSSSGRVEKKNSAQLHPYNLID